MVSARLLGGEYRRLCSRRSLTQVALQAGPKGCPLARSANEDPLAIQERLMRFLDDLYRKPVAVPDAVRPGILTSGIARC